MSHEKHTSSQTAMPTHGTTTTADTTLGPLADQRVGHPKKDTPTEEKEEKDEEEEEAEDEAEEKNTNCEKKGIKCAEENITYHWK